MGFYSVIKNEIRSSAGRQMKLTIILPSRVSLIQKDSIAYFSCVCNLD